MPNRLTPPTLVEVLWEARGYFLVAVACTWAGYVIAHKALWPAQSDWPSLALLWLLLLPAYVARATLFEQTNVKWFAENHDNRQWLRKLSIQFSLITLALNVPLGLLILYASPTPAFDSRQNILIRAGLTILPMYLMTFHLALKWPSEPTLYSFRLRNFFPAFSTCLMPFIFGYSGVNDLPCAIIGVALILSFWALAQFITHKGLAKVGFRVYVIVLLAMIISTFNSDSQVGRWIWVCTFGILTTLVMGVSEAWRVTTRILKGIDYRPAGPYTDTERALYLGGTNLATASLIPSFLLTSLHPATTSIYLSSIIILLALQYICWFVDRTPNKGTYWPTLGLVFGFLIPLAIGMGTRFDSGIVILTGAKLPEQLSDFVTITSVFVLIIGYFIKEYWQSFLRRDQRVQMASIFLSTEVCLVFTGIVSALLGILMPILGFIYPAVFGAISSGLANRMAILLRAYLFGAALCLIVIFFIRLRRGSDPSPAAPGTPPTQPPTHTAAFRLLSGLFTSTRPITSSIPGIMTAVVMFRADANIANIISGSAAMALITMAGFIANDVFDRHKDRLGGVVRPIAAGIIPPMTAVVFASLLFCVAEFIGGVSSQAARVLHLTVALLIIYSPFAHRYTKWKGFYTALLCCLPIAYASAATNLAIDVRLYIVLVLFVLGREILIDVRQLEYDLRASFFTLSGLLGARAAQIIASLLMLIAAICLVFLSSTSPGRFAALLCLALTVLFAFLQRRLSIARQTAWSRLSLGVGAIALAMSV
ncbi:UbiA prenyltransferase family protein [Paludibaculum fermentans]|uniref:UbiA prenyltransferase family protein n=1 Tax=Paludibaculum fermentans TaxID=1473598 RepID=UPI003EBC8DA6